MESWIVFKKDSDRKPHQMVGSVNAADAEMALLQARTVFARRPKAVSLWVVPKADVLMWTNEMLATVDSAESSPTASNEAPSWQVFRKVGQRRAMDFVAHVGEVAADSAENAMQTAIATYRDSKETWVWMVVPTSAITPSDPDDIPSWFEPALTKTYKQQSAYGFVGVKRQSRSRSKQQESKS